MLAIIKYMNHWRHYLKGAKYPIQIKSDCKNLDTFITTKVLNCRQARWAEFLASYDFVLVHIKGTKNPADGPSQHLDYMENIELPTGALISCLVLHLLQPKTHASPLEAHWGHIGMHVNETPGASLRVEKIDPVTEQP